MRSSWNDDARRLPAGASARVAAIFDAERRPSRSHRHDESAALRSYHFQQNAKPHGLGKSDGPRIVVIGQTAYERSEIIERLRRNGHNVVAAAPRHQIKALTVAPRDPGHAGKPLREFLLSIVFIFRDLWLGRLRRQAGQFESRQPLQETSRWRR